MLCISIILVSNPLNFLEVKLKEIGMCSWESGSKPFWGLLKTAVIFFMFSHGFIYAQCKAASKLKLSFASLTILSSRFFLYEMS